jgi:hypothetical protein
MTILTNSFVRKIPSIAITIVVSPVTTLTTDGTIRALFLPTRIAIVGSVHIRMTCLQIAIIAMVVSVAVIARSFFIAIRAIAI